VGAGPLAWLDTPPGTLAFRRGALTCWLNTSDHPVALPDGRLLLGSVPGMDGRSLPVDAAAWVDTT
jgi:alpha-glucosidase